MGLFSSLFGKTEIIEHDFFGKMIFNGGKVAGPTDYFECSREFSPIGKVIEIGIDADKSGPTEKQISFFKTIETNYSAIKQSITPLLEDEFINFIDYFHIVDFEQEFVPVYLKLPRCETQSIVWEISFESTHDENHLFTITMHDLEAKELQIDG